MGVKGLNWHSCALSALYYKSVDVCQIRTTLRLRGKEKPMDCETSSRMSKFHPLVCLQLTVKHSLHQSLYLVYSCIYSLA